MGALLGGEGAGVAHAVREIPRGGEVESSSASGVERVAGVALVLLLVLLPRRGAPAGRLHRASLSLQFAASAHGGTVSGSVPVLQGWAARRLQVQVHVEVQAAAGEVPRGPGGVVRVEAHVAEVADGLGVGERSVTLGQTQV